VFRVMILFINGSLDVKKVVHVNVDDGR